MTQAHAPGAREPLGLVRRAAWRAIARSRWSFISAGLVAALAALCFVAASSSARDLEESCEETYARLRFMSFSLPVSHPPETVVDRVRSVPGVAAAEGRRVAHVSVPVPASASAEQARLMRGEVHSLPTTRRATVDDVAIDAGRYLSGARGEALMETRFARANGYAVGSRVRIFSDGKTLDLTVVGLVSSPEFIWISRSRSDPRPTATTQAILFAGEADVTPLSGGDALSEIHVRAARDDDAGTVMDRCARSVAMWAVEPPVPRASHASFAALRTNRIGLSVMAMTFPPAFALLGCITLASALRVLLLTQRRVIGTLMALGCSDATLMRPWIEAGALLGGIGGGVGALMGIPAGFALTRFYTDVLGLPFIIANLHIGTAIFAASVTTGVSAVACAVISRAHRGQPTASMLAAQEPVHTVLRGSPLSLPRWLAPLLSLRLRLALLGLMRRPARSALVGVGLGIAVAQMTLIGALLESQSATLAAFFGGVNRWTFYASLDGDVTLSALPPIDTWPGVRRVEPALRIVTHVTVGQRSVTLPLLGLPPHASLVRQIAIDGTPLEMGDGSPLFLTPAAVEALNARPGDSARVSLKLDGRQATPSIHATVGPPIDDPIALISRAPLRTVHAIVTAACGTPTNRVNVLLIEADPAQAADVRRRLDHLASVDRVIDLDEERSQVSHLLSLMDAYGLVTALFAGALAVVLAGSASAIGVLERRRELALLEAIGLERREIAHLITHEMVLTWLIVLVPGIALGHAAARVALEAYRNDLVHLRAGLSPELIAAVSMLTLLLGLAASGPALRLLRREPLRDGLDAL